MARFQVTPAVYLLFRDKDKILMLRRFQTGYMNGYYCFPAGHLEGGETFTQAAAREAQEEVGVAIETKSLKLAHVMHR